jgi:hypothetical protein
MYQRPQLSNRSCRANLAHCKGHSSLRAINRSRRAQAHCERALADRVLHAAVSQKVRGRSIFRLVPAAPYPNSLRGRILTRVHAAVRKAESKKGWLSVARAACRNDERRSKLASRSQKCPHQIGKPTPNTLAGSRDQIDSARRGGSMTDRKPLHRFRNKAARQCLRAPQL